MWGISVNQAQGRIYSERLQLAFSKSQRHLAMERVQHIYIEERTITFSLCVSLPGASNRTTDFSFGPGLIINNFSGRESTWAARIRPPAATVEKSSGIQSGVENLSLN